jgi:hypothetical protein
MTSPLLALPRAVCWCQHCGRSYTWARAARLRELEREPRHIATDPDMRAAECVCGARVLHRTDLDPDLLWERIEPTDERAARAVVVARQPLERERDREHERALMMLLLLVLCALGVMGFLARDLGWW